MSDCMTDWQFRNPPPLAPLERDVSGDATAEPLGTVAPAPHGQPQLEERHARTLGARVEGHGRRRPRAGVAGAEQQRVGAGFVRLVGARWQLAARQRPEPEHGELGAVGCRPVPVCCGRVTQVAGARAALARNSPPACAGEAEAVHEDTRVRRVGHSIGRAARAARAQRGRREELRWADGRHARHRREVGERAAELLGRVPV
ncbi:hypothetical protein T492DRAFT_994245 [Pavlovales sp. CCMP2436]|nr:hypothetical protein T492DRAFT_994245 [Pavlovales sp. CCMP2436]